MEKLKKFWTNYKQPMGIALCAVPAVVLSFGFTYAIGRSNGVHDLAKFADIDEKTLFAFFMGSENIESLKAVL